VCFLFIPLHFFLILLFDRRFICGRGNYRFFDALSECALVCVCVFMCDDEPVMGEADLAEWCAEIVFFTF
jgi:hypothetical protein